MHLTGEEIRLPKDHFFALSCSITGQRQAVKSTTCFKKATDLIIYYIFAKLRVTNFPDSLLNH